MTAALPTVLIPVVDSEGSGAVCEVVARDLETITEIRGFDPAIARLADVELIEAGQVALAELLCTNTAAMRGLNAANASSAELGLLLALLVHSRTAKTDLIAATGRIKTDGPVSVGRVDKVDEKSVALAAWMTAQRFEAPKTMVFATPVLAQANESAIEDLRTACAEANVTLTHVAADTLEPLLDHLNLCSRDIGKRELLARFAASAALVLGAAFIWFGAWLIQPPEIAFSTLPWALGDDPQTPLRVRIDLQHAQTTPLAPCYGADQRALVVAGEHLALRVRTNDAGLFDRMSGLRDAAILVLGALSQPLVFPHSLLPASDQITFVDGEVEFGAAIPILEPAEPMKLVVLVKKGGRIQIAALKQALRTAFEASEPGEARLTDLAGIAAGFGRASLVYDFRVVVDRTVCEAQ